MRYFFHIAFDGTHYAGWQKLPGLISIQQTIENLLSEILKTPISIVGCGRTDARVHASQFFFHADIENSWDYDLLFRLNKRTPKDITFIDIIKMDALPHARFDATERQYRYFFHNYQTPYLVNSSSLNLINNLSLIAMSQAVKLLPRYNDYRSFCKSPDKNKHTICHITSARLLTNEAENQFCFEITSNRFLQGMIRTIMYNLLEVGQCKMTLEAFEDLLKNPAPTNNIKLAQPQGLYLTKVTYPYLNRPPLQEILNCLFSEI